MQEEYSQSSLLLIIAGSNWQQNLTATKKVSLSPLSIFILFVFQVC